MIIEKRVPDQFSGGLLFLLGQERSFGNGAVKLITSIEDPVVIEKILAHVRAKGSESVVSRLARRPEPRAPPDVWN